MICVAASFSVMGVSQSVFSQRRKDAKFRKRRKELKSERLQRPGRRAFEEPARPHAQTMMPGRQALSVKRKPRLSRQRTADHLSGGKHRSSLGPEAHRFAKFDKVFRFEFAAFNKSAHVVSEQA